MKNKLTPQTVHLLKRVQERITQHPEKYNQSLSCGTSYCVAGHLGVLLGMNMNETSCREVGESLGMNIAQIRELFYTVPVNTNRQERDHARRAANGVAHIQRFLEANT